MSLTGSDILGVAAVVFALISVVIINAAVFDRRWLSGENTWLKPLRFSVSLTIHFLTVAVISKCLPNAQDHSAWMVWTAITSVAAGLFAIGYMAVQAGRLQHSHFNTSTPLEAGLLGLLGLSAFVVLAPTLVLGFDAAIHPLDGWPTCVRIGVATGLLTGAALTVVTGMRMGAAGSHFAAVGEKATRPMAITGWSLIASDVRPAHFLANHMNQAAPLAGLGASLFLPSVAADVLTLAFAASWLTLTLVALRSASSKSRPGGAAPEALSRAQPEIIVPNV